MSYPNKVMLSENHLLVLTWSSIGACKCNRVSHRLLIYLPYTDLSLVKDSVINEKNIEVILICTSNTYWFLYTIDVISAIRYG